jgi:preprotein translocase subunit SecB
VPAKKNSPSDLDRRYASFLKGIQLWALGLQASRSFLDRAAYADLHEKDKLTRRITTEYELCDVTKDFFNVSAKLRLSVEGKGRAEPPAVIVECTYEAHFHCDSCNISRELAERFTEAELRIVVWPYFRQFVNDTTARMWIQPILIPFSAVS